MHNSPDCRALRADIVSTLDMLSQKVAADSDVQDAIRLLGQAIAAWATVPDDAFPETGAGFGSTVVFEDLDQGVRDCCTLMAGPLLDIEGGQVSLASPVGRALIGRDAGDVVTVTTPHRVRRLKVLSVSTLKDTLTRVAGRLTRAAA